MFAWAVEEGADMNLDESSAPWVFDEGELPSWAAPPVKRTKPPLDFGIGIPAVTPEPLWPVFGRILVLWLIVAASFPLIAAIGQYLNTTSGTGEMLVISCLIGFAIGLFLYLQQMYDRLTARRLGPLHPSNLPNAPSFYLVIAPPIVIPVLLLFARCFYIAFAERFIGVGFACLFCLFVFHRFGKDPICFMQELFLADLAIEPAERRTRPRISGRPNVTKLAIVLLVVLLAPAYLTNLWGILFVIALCVFDFRRSFTPLLRFGTWQTVLGALIVRARKTVFEFVEYEPSDEYHWKPAEALGSRRDTFNILLFSLGLALVSGLAYFIPWEPFAALFVPRFRTDLLFIPDYDLANYRWVRAPFALAQRAETQAAYFLCFVIAIVLSFAIPAAVLFLTYLEPLAELEAMAQEFKRKRPSA